MNLSITTVSLRVECCSCKLGVSIKCYVLSVVMLSVVMLSVVMLSVEMLSAVILSVVILSVVMLSVVMLSVVMLSVVMLSVVMLSVVAPYRGVIWSIIKNQNMYWNITLLHCSFMSLQMAALSFSDTKDGICKIV
jgi:hypothetical protein